MKKVIIGTALVLGLAAGVAVAQGNYWGGYHMMDGNGHYGMTGGYRMMGDDGVGACPGAVGYGQSEESLKNYQQFLDTTKDLRKNMHELRFEYAEAYRNPKTDRETLAKLEDQINNLGRKIHEARQESGAKQ